MAYETSTATPSPQRATQAELARSLNVSRQAVNDLVRRGILRLDDDGMLDLETARAALLDHVRPSGKTTAALAAQGLMPSATEATPPAAPTDDDGLPTSYHVARTLRESEEAHMARLKRRTMEQELIRVDAVEAVWGAALASVREHLLQLRARLAPLLAAETDVFAIEQMLDAEHAQALATLAAVDAMAGQRPADPAAK